MIVELTPRKLEAVRREVLRQAERLTLEILAQMMLDEALRR